MGLAGTPSGPRLAGGSRRSEAGAPYGGLGPPSAGSFPVSLVGGAPTTDIRTTTRTTARTTARTTTRTTAHAARAVLRLRPDAGGGILRAPGNGPGAVSAGGGVAVRGDGMADTVAAGRATAFGALLRRHRLAAGLTQEALAERGGLSVQAVSALERGARGRPQRETLRLLVVALGLTGAARAAFEAAARAPGTAPPDAAATAPPGGHTPPARPAGPVTVTFLFTDLEGSPRLQQAHPAASRDAVAHRHALLRGAVEAHGGVVFEAAGAAVCAAFAQATDAVAAALAGQLGAAGAAGGGPGRAGRGRPAGADGAAHGRGRAPGGALRRGAALPLRPAAGDGARGAGGALRGHGRAGAGRAPRGGACATSGPTGCRTWPAPSASTSSCTRRSPADFPPLRTLDARPHNLPLQLTSFVGRERELGEVAALLARRTAW